MTVELKKIRDMGAKIQITPDVCGHRRKQTAGRVELIISVRHNCNILNTYIHDNI